MSPPLPTELLLEIYSWLFLSAFHFPHESYFPEATDFLKPRWHDIKNLTLVSRRSREIALSLWFHTVIIDDYEVWEECDWEIVSFAYKSARIIHYLDGGYISPSRFLAKFTRAHTLRINFPVTHITEDGDHFDIGAPQLLDIFRDTIPSPESSSDKLEVLPCIKHLEIRGITWLEPRAMGYISKFFPNLRTLRLKQPLVWCDACNTLGNPDFMDFLSTPRKLKGVEIVYNNSGCKGLPSGYVKFLSPLPYLHTINFTVACGVGLPWYEDLFQVSKSSQNSSSKTSSNTSPRPPDIFLREHEPPNIPGLHLISDLPPTQDDDGLPRLYGWSGECQACLVNLALDPGFRRLWNARRQTFYDTAAKTAETTLLPSLRKVEWELLELSHVNWPRLL